MKPDDLRPTPLSQVRKWFWIILLFGILGAVAGYSLSIGNRQIYMSTAQVLVSPYSLSVLEYEPATLNLSRTEVVSETQMELMRARDQLDRVATAVREAVSGTALETHLPGSPVALRDFIANRLSIRRLSGAEILNVSFSADDPELAAIVANQVVNQFLKTLREAKADELEKVAATLELRVSALEVEAEAADRAMVEAQRELDAVAAARRTSVAAAIANATQGLELLESLNQGNAPIDPQTVLDDTQTVLTNTLDELNRMASAEGLEAQATQTTALARLETLEREADVRGKLHRGMLQRLLEVRELANFLSEDARLVAEAVPAATPSNLRPEVLAVMGFLAFALLATLVAATSGTAGAAGRDWA